MRVLNGPNAMHLVNEWENDEDYPTDIDSAVRREAKRLLILEKLVAKPETDLVTTDEYNDDEYR